MFGLYMLAIYLGVAVIGAGFVALLVVVALAVGLVTHPIRTLALVFPQARRPGRRTGVDPRVDRLVLDRPYKAGLRPVLLGIHRRDRRVHPYPRVRRVDSRTAHQGRTPSHETCRRAGNRPGDDAHAGIERSGRGVRIDPGRPARLPMTCRPQDGTNRGWIMDFATGTRKEGHDGQSRAIAAHTGTARGTARP